MHVCIYTYVYICVYACFCARSRTLAQDDSFQRGSPCEKPAMRPTALPTMKSACRVRARVRVLAVREGNHTKAIASHIPAIASGVRAGCGDSISNNRWL